MLSRGFNNGVPKTDTNNCDRLADVDDVFRGRLACVWRQLSLLVQVTGDLFDDLVGEFRTLAGRTDCLRLRVGRLEFAVEKFKLATTTVKPDGNLATGTCSSGTDCSGNLATVSVRHDNLATDSDHCHSGNVFRPTNRNVSLVRFYSVADPSPVPRISECDRLRTDDVCGAEVFSRNPVVLDGWRGEAEEEVVTKQTSRCRAVPSLRRIRPPNITKNARDSDDEKTVTTATTDAETGDDSHSEMFPSGKSLYFSVPQATVVVRVDVSGSSYQRLREFHALSNGRSVDDDDDGYIAVECKTTSGNRPRTIGSISNLVFHEVGHAKPHGDVVKRRNSAKLPHNKVMSQTLGVYAPTKKSWRHVEETDSKSCSSSWRSSIKSIFKMSRSKSRELWSRSCAEETATARTELQSEDKKSYLHRTTSLPRSLKSSAKLPNCDGFSAIRSTSVEGRLNIHRVVAATNPDVVVAATNLTRPVVAGERLGRSLTAKSLSQGRLPSSTERVTTTRPSSMEVKMPALDEEGLPTLSVFGNESNSLSVTLTENPSGSFSNEMLSSNDDKENCHTSSGGWEGIDNRNGFNIQKETPLSQNLFDSKAFLNYFPTCDSQQTKSVSLKSSIRPHAIKSGFLLATFKHDNVSAEMENRSSLDRGNPCTYATVPYAQTGPDNDAAEEEEIPNWSRKRNDQQRQQQQQQQQSGSVFRRIEKSDSKLGRRSSFLEKLRNLGRTNSSKSPRVVFDVASPQPVYSSLTMGEMISLSHDGPALGSLTPQLPRSESKELQKLADLADKMAAERARNANSPNFPVSPLSSSSSSSSVALPRRPGDVNTNRATTERNVFVFPSLENCCENGNDDIKNNDEMLRLSLGLGNANDNSAVVFKYDDDIDDKQISPQTQIGASNHHPTPSVQTIQTTRSLQRTKDLESILELDGENASPAVARNTRIVVDDTNRDVETGKIDKSFIEISAKTERRLMNKLTVDVSGGRMNVPVETFTSSTDRLLESKRLPVADSGRSIITTLKSAISASSANNNVPDKCDRVQIDADCNEADHQQQSRLVPANARLIISSPLADRAFFVDNPHKRSVCRPVSPDNFTRLCSVESPVLGPSLSASSDDRSPSFVTRVSLPSSSSPWKKKSPDDVGNRPPGFPVTIRERVDPSNHGRSWYDGIDLSPSSTTTQNAPRNVGSQSAIYDIQKENGNPSPSPSPTSHKTFTSFVRSSATLDDRVRSDVQRWNASTIERDSLVGATHPSVRTDDPGRTQPESSRNIGANARTQPEPSKLEIDGRRCARVVFPVSSSSSPTEEKITFPNSSSSLDRRIVVVNAASARTTKTNARSVGKPSVKLLQTSPCTNQRSRTTTTDGIFS